MTSLRMLPAMDIHQNNDEHDIHYYLSKNRYPTDESNDPFELFICPYLADHKVTSKRWRIHLQKCKENYGGNTKPCVFNASHHVPMPEYEWHTMTCSDRNILRKEYEKRDWVLASQVNHNPDWIEPDTGEAWDDEIQEDRPEFTLDVKKGMPLALKPHESPKEMYFDEEEGADDEENYEETNGEAEQVPSILEEELIPEKPSNWNEMSKTQKKNHKRKYERQRQRMVEEGITEADFAPVKDPKLWTAKAREDKLNAIKAKFPMADDKANASRFDYTSLLNIVCQKVRINLPEYQPCGAGHGGFAFRCRVHQTWYEGQEFASTKKDAKHECAKWALLYMEIPGIDVEAPTSRAMPVHPRLLQQSAEMREGDEVGRLMEAGMYHAKKTTSLRQPKLDAGVPGSPQKHPRESAPQVQPAMNSMANFVQQLQLTEQEEEEQEQQQQQQQHQQDNSMAAFVRRQQEEEKGMHQMQEQHPPQSQQVHRGWEMRSTPLQGAQQIRQPQQVRPQQVRPQQPQLQQMRPQQPQPQQMRQQQMRQQQPRTQSSQPQKAWGGWGAPQQPANPPQNMQPATGMGGASGFNDDLSSSMNSVSLDSGMDFPSLGSDEWKTVPKKSSAVGRGRGRGRMTTTMKL